MDIKDKGHTQGWGFEYLTWGIFWEATRLSYKFELEWHQKRYFLFKLCLNILTLGEIFILQGKKVRELWSGFGK